MQRIIPPKIQQYIELKKDGMGWKVAEDAPTEIKKDIKVIADEIDNEFSLEEI